MIKRILPFLDWFKDFNASNLRMDLVAGLTVALVLIPQSMAYAQLAGLPPFYGLYAAFLPPMIAALFGSSRQLATGPVAVVSLMTSATLEPLATAGSQGYIAYAVLLALIVGAFQFALGLLRLGVVVNFLSHPIVNGFTNAAAIIIATSQLSKIFGVYVDKAEHHYETIVRVVAGAFNYTHWPTFFLAALAFGIMYGFRRLNPKIPNVLVAVVTTTLISWAIGFEHNHKADITSIESPEIHKNFNNLNKEIDLIETIGKNRALLSKQVAEAEESYGEDSIEVHRLYAEIDILNLRIKGAKKAAHLARKFIRAELLEAVDEGNNNLRFYPVGKAPSGNKTDGRLWRMMVGNRHVEESAIVLTGGGAVVGVIPEGLPKISLPVIDMSVLGKLFAAAVIISLLGFMEAISIAKAMSVKTGQRLDPNQELIGQGLANMIGSMGLSYPVSGSFSRSAVNLQAGAVTGFSSVVTSLVVVIVLLFFTPLLYHLPQSVLASVIMMAVLGLVNVKGFVHAYNAKRTDGIISVISFVCTLIFAPHLDRGIFVGVLLSLGLFLYKSMKPRVTFLSRHQDGTFRDAKTWNLERCKHILVLRFYGKLFFANTTVLERNILEEIGNMPELKHIVIVGNGISDVDSSGEEIIGQIVDEVRRQGYKLSFTALRDPVLDVMSRTGLIEKIGKENLYGNVHMALDDIIYGIHEDSDEDPCPLLTHSPKE
ncbi:MAG: STAS domain-containing protein [Proteobacteria bacterium]|nr:STAS domain-containing protein [Pseudomonadota bacterium]